MKFMIPLLLAVLPTLSFAAIAARGRPRPA